RGLLLGDRLEPSGRERACRRRAQGGHQRSRADELRRGRGGRVVRGVGSGTHLPVRSVTLAPLLAAAALATAPAHDWTRFGYDAARSSSFPYTTGITATSVRRLRRQRIDLEGTID